MISWQSSETYQKQSITLKMVIGRMVNIIKLLKVESVLMMYGRNSILPQMKTHILADLVVLTLTVEATRQESIMSSERLCRLNFTFEL